MFWGFKSQCKKCGSCRHGASDTVGKRQQLHNKHVTTKWQGFPPSSVGKESACNAGDPGSISGSGRAPGEGVGYPLQYSWASLVVQLVKNLPTMWEIWVWSLGWEDPLEKGIATPVFWPGEFHGLYSSWGRKESDRLSNFHFHKSAKPNKYRVLKA